MSAATSWNASAKPIGHSIVLHRGRRLIRHPQ
jgi:hypothetical protein